MNSIVILLTGTIQPVNVHQLALTSPQKREQEYLNAIKKWTQLGYPVIFCENSNYDSQLINDFVNSIDDGLFEYLKFDTRASYLGKGNGEAEIIDYVFNNSKLIKDDTIICKATGKNFISNAKKLLTKIRLPKYSDKIIIANLTRKLTWADSRLYFFKKEFYYNYWLSYAKYIDEPNKIFFEHVLAKSIHALLATNDKCYKWDMLPYPPILEGYSGTFAKKYANNIFLTFFQKAFHSVKIKMFSTSK
jgi:hypothetical protein